MPVRGTRMALSLGKLNFSCAVIGLTFINRTCRQRTGTPKFRGSGCQFLQSQCHRSPRTGIALGTRLRKPWSGPVTWVQNMDIFDSYSSRSGKIFLTEIYKYSKQINSQNTSQSILFTVCVAKFGTNQPKSLKAPSMFSKIYRYFWKFSNYSQTKPKAQLFLNMISKLHLAGVSN
jgi:hypothetical protein